jgi:hypothetical protein
MSDGFRNILPALLRIILAGMLSILMAASAGCRGEGDPVEPDETDGGNATEPDDQDDDDPGNDNDDNPDNDNDNAEDPEPWIASCGPGERVFVRAGVVEWGGKTQNRRIAHARLFQARQGRHFLRREGMGLVA